MVLVSHGCVTVPLVATFSRLVGSRTRGETLPRQQNIFKSDAQLQHGSYLGLRPGIASDLLQHMKIFGPCPKIALNVDFLWLTSMDVFASRKAVNISETAKLLGISRDLVYQLIHEGRLRAVSVGKRRRLVPLSEIERLLEDGNQA